MYGHLDIAQLARFVAIAETGSFRAAAHRLGITQPTLSWSIQQLEQTLGATLIERGARGAKLTELGEVLLPRARLITSESERAASDFAEMKGAREASISIGVAPMFVANILPRASAGTLLKIPGLHVRVIEGHSADLIAALRAGEIDVAFGGRPNETDMTGVTFEKIFEQRYALVARAGHPIFKLKRAKDEDVAKYAWAVFDTARMDGVEKERPAAKSMKMPRIAVRSSSMEYLKAIALDTDLFSYLALDYVRAEINAGRLRAVQAPSIVTAAAVGILVRDKSAQTLAMVTFKAELRKACATMAKR